MISISLGHYIADAQSQSDLQTVLLVLPLSQQQTKSVQGHMQYIKMMKETTQGCLPVYIVAQCRCWAVGWSSYIPEVFAVFKGNFDIESNGEPDTEIVDG
eukprot:scaffold117941_cov60-Attheya_sp.AAC.8